MLEERIPNKNKVEFDSEFTPENEINTRASKEHNLRYDRAKKFYVDSEGCLIRDSYGQVL